MRSSVAHLLSLVAVLGISTGARATTTEASIHASIDPTHRVEGWDRPRSAGPETADLGGPRSSIDARLAAVRSRPVTRSEAGAQDPRLAAALTEIAASAGPQARVGIAVSDLATGVSVFDLDAQALLNPASNLKLLTAAAAVDLLGESFRFETRVVRRDDTLVLVGGGDPSLQREDLRAVVEALSPTDVEGVRRIVVDDSAFSARRFGPGYDPEGPGHSYQAPSGALSLQFNTLEITVQPTEAGALVDVSARPACDHVRIVNGATTGRGSALSVTTRERDGATEVVVAGHLPRGAAPFKIRRRIYDPGLFTGTVFARMLAQHFGTTVAPVERGALDGEGTTVFVHRSEPLPRVLESALKFSNNFTTEQVLRTLGHLDTAEPGDWDNGRAVVRRYWDALGLPQDALVFDNAAGLGDGARITPHALVELLGATTSSARSGLLDALPVAGREGTLASRLRRTRGRVHAKTGTLDDASALTGVISDPDGTPRLAFSVLVNGRIGTTRARRVQDRVVRALLASL